MRVGAVMMTATATATRVPIVIVTVTVTVIRLGCLGVGSGVVGFC
jgi:hypothetical protein